MEPRKNASLALPSRRINPDRASVRDPDKAAMIAHMLREGDPLADAVVVELREVGRTAYQKLDSCLRNGLAATPDAPPAIAALLRAAETVPDWVDPGILQRPCAAALSIEPLWSGPVAFGLGSLLHTYGSPAISRVLVNTGRLTTMAPRRLLETGIWTSHVQLPGGLLRGAPGYIATIQVRLTHATQRANSLRRGWDVDVWGMPICQVDLARTWLDFTLVPYRALADLGFDFTDEELRELYEFWHYVGYLLGIDPALYREVHDHAQAEELLDLIETTNGPPDENSRALVSAALDLLTGQLMSILNTPPALTTDMAHALARYIQGDQFADALGMQTPEVLYLIPLVVHDNQSTRRLQRLIPGAWEQSIEQNIEQYRALVATPIGPTTYQTYLSTPAGGRSPSGHPATDVGG